MNAPYRNLLLAVSLFATGNCFADWNGGIEAGAKNDKPTLRLFAANQSDPLSHYAYVDYAGGDNFIVGYNPTFKISHSVYSFGRFSIEEGDTASVEREVDALVGIGNNLFQRGNTQVKVETGIGGRLLRFNAADDQTDGFAFVSGNIKTSLLSLLRFDATIDTKVGDGQTTLDGEAGLSIPIGIGKAFRYVYSVKRYNFDDREDINTEDTFYKFTYGF